MKFAFSKKTLTVILALGSTYAWYTNIHEIISFNDFYGTLLRFQNTVSPNPFLTPCFYGGIAFLLALFLSIKGNKYLHLLLIAGTLFAWGNWSWGIAQFYLFNLSESISCSGTTTSNPFLTPCFIGASFFTLALVNSFFIRKSKLNKKLTTNNKEN